DPVTEEPTDQPAEPAAEEPATEEPAAEEPSTEEEPTGEEEPSTEEEPTEEPTAEEEPTEEPAAEEEPIAEAEPTAEEPAAEEPAAEEPAEEAAPATASTYTLNTSASRLYVQVFKDPDTIGAGASHDHVVVAKGWSGTVTWHPTDASQCQIDITVPVSKLAVDSPAMRSAVGYEGELSDSQRSSVKKNMLASDQLNSSSFSNITFSSTSCNATTGSVKVTGKMTIRGKSKTITTTLNVSLDGGFSATGTLTASHTDFGFDPFTAMMGALKNKNQMKFTIKLKS
ncbi:MAG: polyisoprenoid-binding protein YceI, partial [Myxococcota bacterium]